MKASAFSGLSLTEAAEAPGAALDQRLFVPASASSQERALLTTKQRANAPTLPRDNAPTDPDTDERTLARDEEAALASSRVRSREPRRERRAADGHETSSGLRCQRPPVRTIERHSHDIFQDQVRWMNRLKLDLEERYGAKVTGNAMVQLALDLFRDDFLSLGEESSLVRVLVQGRRSHPARRDEYSGGQEGEEDGR